MILEAIRLLDVPEAAETCPGPHSGDERPPAVPAGGAAFAECDRCGTVSQICPHDDCGARTRAGGLHCRLCGRPLPEEWLKRAWLRLPEDSALGEPGEPKQVPGAATDEECHLLASDAWVALQVGNRVHLLEPGPGLLPVEAVDLEPGEALIELRHARDRALTWEMWTTHRVLRYDLRRAGQQVGSWVSEDDGRFPSERGELLWVSHDLLAFHQRGVGTSVWSRDRLHFSVPELLPRPAWLNKSDFVCSGRDQLLVGSTAERRESALPVPPALIDVGEPLAGQAPIYDPRADRVYVSGDRTVFWWQPGSRKLIPFHTAGGGALIRSPQGVVVLEADRVRIFAHDERLLWDSRLKMPDFALAALAWDHRGDALLLPCAGRASAATPLLVIDLARPDARPDGPLHATLDGQLPAAPRLAPGGIVAVTRDTAPGGPTALRWIGLAPRAARGGP